MKRITLGKDVKEPKLNFTNKVEGFYGADDDNFLRTGLFGGGRNTGGETVCKVQTVHNLKKLKAMFDNAVHKEDNCISPVGWRCYLFLENNEIKIKTIKNKSYDKTVNTSLGSITCQDKGEWGGSLILIAENGEEYYYDSFSCSFEDILEYGGKVYAISSLAHLFGRKCALHEIKKSNGKYQIVTVFECDDMYFSGYYLDENYLYFYSNEHYNGLCRFNLDNNQLEIIHTDLCSTIDVNSLIKKDNFIYIHGNYNIVKYDLNTREIDSIYTNLEYDEISEFWFVNNDVKLIDVWGELIIDGEE